jgi:RNA 2',3'-cyclic 3'-phosphodiesterase
MMRLFVGINLPPELKLRLSLLCGGVPHAKWVDAGNFHVTLRFIGEVDEGMASDVDLALSQIRARRFRLGIAGTGHFGSGDKPRQLWAGIERSPDLEQLHEKVENALMRIGIPPEPRKYTPHVTLARFAQPPGPKFHAYLAMHALFRAEPFPVDRFSLIASYLTKAGPLYEDQAEYGLS